MCTYTDKSCSPGKHAAREFVGKHLASHDEYAIVIVGWDKPKPGRPWDLFQCGDIPYFESQGFRRDRIIVCGFSDATGQDDRAREWAVGNYPGVIASPHACIGRTTIWALEQGYTLNLINVDLCGSVKTAAPIVRLVLEAVKAAPWHQRAQTVVALTHVRGRDGLGNGTDDAQRDLYLWAQIKDLVPCPIDGNRPEYAERKYTYQSDTKDAQGYTVRYGSPMCVKVFKPRYMCKKCGKLDEHPVTHRKNCNKVWDEKPYIPPAYVSDGTRHCGRCGESGHYRVTCTRLL